MRNANAIRAIAAWHFSKRTAVGGSYVNTFNFLVLPLGVFHFQIHYWPVSQSASQPACLPSWAICMWADCCVSHGYALEIRAVLPLTLRLLPLINYRVELCFSFRLFCVLFFYFFFFSLPFFFLFYIFFCWLSSLLAVKCDICNTLLTYCVGQLKGF